MQNVVLIVHLLLALALIAVVLMQRSEGGGLGIGGGGGAVSGRAAATALGKFTWILGIAFLITSITLTILVARDSADVSVIDRLVDAPVRSQPGTGPAAPAGDLLPPIADGDAPLVPAGD